MTQTAEIEAMIERLQLEPHPEGGFYKERYRSPLSVQRADGAQRSAYTLIDFLLPEGVESQWHRVLGADETWHFCAGSPLLLRRQHHGQAIEELTLGAHPLSSWQLIPAGCWQAARSTGAWTLVHCTVAPGFSFDDFELRS